MKEDSKKRKTPRFIAFLVVIAMFMIMNQRALAASYSTTASLAGASVYAHLYVGSTYSTADTSCSGSSSVCLAKAYFTYYYTDSAGVAHIATSEDTQAGGGAAYATAGSSGLNVRAISGSSHHEVWYNGQHWDANLPIPTL